MKGRMKKIALYGGLIVLSWVVVGLGAARQKTLPVDDFRTVIVNDENNHFLGSDDVEELVMDVHGRPLAEVSRGEVKVAEIEQELRENPFVKEAEAYTELGGDLVVEMELRKPLARVMFEDGSGFYLDKDYNKLDLSQRYAANTILVRGLAWEPLLPRDSIGSAQILDLQEFLEYVDGDDFLRSQVSEVVLEEDGDLVIYPEVGDVVIEFGKAERIEEKFDNMKLFYDKVLNKIGWDKYRQISLKYRGQVIAEREE